MKNFILSALLLVGISSFADSAYLDSAPMYTCGGTIQLRESDNGDLNVVFKGFQNRTYCTDLKFVDVSSGRTIKSYKFEGTSYTLSNSQEYSLGTDCRLGVQLTNQYAGTLEKFEIVLGYCKRSSSSHSSQQSSRFSFDISGSGNCKLNIDGQYANKLVDDVYCAPLNGQKKVYVSYEFSNKGNCKIMINGSYSNQNTSDSLCNARF